jgi:hypothetical protein
MKAFLMHRAADFDLEGELPANAATLTQDLELHTLWDAMAAGDPFLFEVARRALLLGLLDPEEIIYRQAVLSDCLENESTESKARELYALAGEALAAEKSVWGGLLSDSPRSMLGTSVQKMELLVGFLRRLREMVGEHADKFRSPGFTRFFEMLAGELSDDYFELVERELRELKFRGGALMSAQLTAGNRSTGYMLRRPREQSRLGRVLDRSGYSFTIPDRDENGFRALSELEDKGLNIASNALAQSVDHVKSFFEMLRAEIGFYVSCLNLHGRLAKKDEPVSLPEPLPSGERTLSAQGVYDVCLTLTIEPRVVGNDVSANGKRLVMITGANQGGKSTLLRGLGLAQLMMQAGMFVPSQSFSAEVCDGVFTHYKREEDAAMASGKLDEELSRMSKIASQIRPHSMLLCNESFASTNEREGSEIARQVIHAMVDEEVKVLFVTHMFDLAHGLYDEQLDSALFLRAQRGSDGQRSFKLAEGEPLPTSYGEDSYQRVFGKPLRPRARALPEAKR